MNLTSIVSRNDDFIWRVIDGEAVLLSPIGDQLHALNELGTFVWKLADGSRSVAGIIEQICEEFEVEKQRAEQDTLVFLRNLLAVKAVYMIS